ncbi:hypothetical protein QBZ16_005070 [Prototheca wickerhamii]|uniref:PRP1 splicing factor N-terminal domain-containing protein n=1 Tax=Prototheca wickerhamii TaxID=3111 RepID=A0AAD9IFT6_PROWI|nr:hypothetical protein QBZ16_005070 [Prototheca wickerhamii]
MALRAPSRAPQAPGAKIDFNALKPPPGYVAGLGRGASGFTTRSDIGPSMPAPEAQAENKEDDESKFDEFLGNDAGALAATGAYDDEDREADEVWEKLDERMDERRKAQREQRMKEELDKFRMSNPKIGDLFKDLKRGLADLDTSAWEGIPDIGDTTVKRQKRSEIFTPAPDSLLAAAAGASATATALDARGGLETPGGASSLTAVGAGRSTVVQLKLDRISDSVSGQTVVDPKGYLTDLKSVALKSDAEISDIKKARLLLKSVIRTNPRHGPGWVAAARLEEVAGKLPAARELALKGAEMAPGYADVWLEAARLHPPETAKAVLARGVAALPESVPLWLAAARLEGSDEARKRVLLRALERVPQSVRLWRAAVELSDEDDARILLSRAVECCPQHVELWLALARLETHKNAQKVLNRARQAVPTSAEVWVTASKLEEAAGAAEAPAKIVPRALKSLAANGVVIDRDWWLREAEAAERAAPPFPATCRAIVAAVVGVGVEEADRKRTWVADAEEALRRGAVETARALYAAALAAYPGKKSIWRAAAELERAHGSPEAVDALLRRAVQYCPGAEVLWLMAAKERWRAGDVGGARAVLEEAFARNPDSEEIWLAAFKVEREAREVERARLILARAREHEPASTARVWMKSAALEREAGDAAAERALLAEGLRRFPDSWKMHLMLGQEAERRGDAPAARAAYAAGTRLCPRVPTVWVAAARLEEGQGAFRARARCWSRRACATRARPSSGWRPRAPRRGRATPRPPRRCSRALQECPDAGALWAEAVRVASRATRKSRSVDALKRCNDDPAVVAAVARLFWDDRKVDKARAWLERAVTLAPDVGDFWALLLKFEAAHGTPARQEDVLRRAAAAEPRHGERWQAVAKDPANAFVPFEALLKKLASVIDTEAPM